MVKESEYFVRFSTVCRSAVDISARGREELVDKTSCPRIDGVSYDWDVDLSVAVVELVLVEDTVVAVPPVVEII